MLYNAEEKILCRSLFSTLTQSTVCTQGSGKRGDSQEGGKPQVVYPLVRPRDVSAISLASQAAKCDSCFVQSAQTTTPSGGAAMHEACFLSNYSVSQPVPPAGKFSFYGIIVPQFFRRFLHKMMKDFLRQYRIIEQE